MATPNLPVTKPTKAIVAALWNTAAALQIFLGVILTATDDGAVDVMDVAPLLTGALTLAYTVRAVWKTRNDPVSTVPEA